MHRRALQQYPPTIKIRSLTRHAPASDCPMLNCATVVHWSKSGLYTSVSMTSIRLLIPELPPMTKILSQIGMIKWNN